MTEPDSHTIERKPTETLRAVLLAFGLVLALSVATFYIEIVWHGQIGAGSLSGVAVVFILAAITAFPGLGRLGLSRRELLTIYAILAVATPVIGRAILFFMLPKTVIYYHMARAHPDWEAGFLGYIPLWWAPTDPRAVENFFLGQARVPWSLWLVPLMAWLAFVLCFFLTTFFLMALVQRQWVTNERLSFPLAQVPLQTFQDPPPGIGASVAWLPLARTFWIGLAFSLLLSFYSSLSGRLPALPTVPLGPVTLVQRQQVGPLAGLGEFDITLWPWFIGLIYIIPKELSFSCWFFWVLRLALHVGAIAAGATPMDPQEWYHSGFPAPYHQGTGALFALGIWVLWIARRHLVRAARIALTGLPPGADAHEPVSYRWSFLGLLVSLSATVLFCWLSGCRLIFGLGMMAVFIVYFMMVARLRAETALEPSVLDMYQVLTIPGTGILRPREIVTLVTMRWATFPSPGETLPVCTATALENMKIADAAGMNQRRVSAAVVGGFALALLAGAAITLAGLYHYGYFGTGAGAAPYCPSMQSRKDGALVMQLFTTAARPDSHGMLGMLAGGAIAVLLGMFRLRLWWWPFHPVGYIIANSWGMHWYLVPFLIGWGSKTLVLRYGGLRLYRATVPLAIGLIVGDMLNRAIWSVIALATRGALA
jgi:hypothetical protein